MKCIEFDIGSYNNDTFTQVGIVPSIILVRCKDETVRYYMLVLDWLCWYVELKINMR